MGSALSQAEKDVYRTFKFKLAAQEKQFCKKKLKDIVKWAFKNFPDATAPMVYKSEFWDSVGTKLYDLATKRDKATAELLPVFRAVYETLRAEERDQKINTKETKETEIANPLTSTLSPNPTVGTREWSPNTECCIKAEELVAEEKSQTILPLLCSFPSSPSDFPVDGLQDNKDQLISSPPYSLYPNPVCTPRPHSPILSTFLPTCTVAKQNGVEDLASQCSQLAPKMAAGHSPASSYPSQDSASGPTPSTPGHAPSGAGHASLLGAGTSPLSHTPSGETGTPPTWVPEGPASKMAAPTLLAPHPSPKPRHMHKLHSNKELSTVSHSSFSSNSYLKNLHLPESREDPWAKIRKAAVKEGEWGLVSKMSAFPLCYRRGRVSEWEPLAYGEVKELCKAARECGRQSPHFQNLMSATLAAHVLIPHDMKYIMAMLLSPTEYTLWEIGWKRLLNQMLWDHHGDQAWRELTIEHIAGEGAHSDPDDQAAVLTQPVLNEIKEAARKAMIQVPDGSRPDFDFADVRQDPNEPYIKFLDRLKLALDRQILLERAKEELLKRLAVANANEQCKRVLRTLPIDPEPTIPEMVEACDRLVTPGYAANIQAQAFAQALATFQNSSRDPQNQPCFNCGDRGHWQKDHNQTKRRPFARPCKHQLTNKPSLKQGKVPRFQGSGKLSVGQRCTMTKVSLSPVPGTIGGQEAASFHHH
ncbi:endogenous retrovirus group K member 6 Gag polyprotein-like [Parus major]|uniref:endogenous retrovirus group K member 6 Gag polyprotein-like n=1 Tax=Parus major TaxID=9157 RepID=UPI00077105A3|nr:endogenous retrovirus group K member 6 Gag polyprotein-like [Parus major]